jgi:Kef-type K+ transport system membrane component KefB
MTADLLASIVAILLSLAASYVPGFSPWFAKLDGIQKRLLMLGLLAAAAGGSFALACAGLAADMGFSLTCDQPGAIGLMRIFVIAVISNQAACAISPHLQKELDNAKARSARRVS